MEKKEPSYNVGGNVNSNNKLWRSVFIPIPKKGNSKKCSKYHTIALISHARKVMLEIFKLAFSSSWELPGIHARKGRGTRDQITNICQEHKSFPGGSDGRESTWNVGDLGSIPGLWRSPEGGLGNPLQCSCLNTVSLDRGAWQSTVQGVTKNQIKGILEKHLLHWLC